MPDNFINYFAAIEFSYLHISANNIFVGF